MKSQRICPQIVFRIYCYYFYCTCLFLLTCCPGQSWERGLGDECPGLLLLVLGDGTLSLGRHQAVAVGGSKASSRIPLLPYLEVKGHRQGARSHVHISPGSGDLEPRESQ